MKQILLSCVSVFCFSITVNSQISFIKHSINASTGNNPYAIDSGQLSRDLIGGEYYNDIVIGTDGGNTVEYYKNNGNGTFSSGTTLVANAPNDLLYVEGIHIADINDDGDNDILATSFGNDNLVWFENTGSGTFEDAVTISSSIDGAGTVITGNIDNDINNYLDIVVIAFGPDGDTDSVIWMAGNGDGTFGAFQYIVPETAGNGPGDVHLADFDGDGDLDAVVAFNETGDVEIYDNRFIPDGSVSFVKYTNTVSTGNDYLFDIAFADVDNDMDLDIIKADIGGAGDVSYIIADDLPTDGVNTTFTELLISTGTSISRPASASIADLDNDTNNDVVSTNAGTAGSDVEWFESTDVGGVFETEAEIDDSQQFVYSQTINDFDNDGDLDIATISYNQHDVNWFENNFDTLNTPTFLIEESISVFPNPAKNILYFRGQLSETFKISVYNILGKRVINTTLNENSYLDISQLNNGVYILKLEDSNITFKFIKE